MQQQMPSPESQLRNVKDFLIVYNSMTEHCFNKCITNMNYRTLTKDEQTCVNNCTHRFTQTNRRFMQQFMEHTPEMMKRKQEAAQQQMEKLQKLEEAAQLQETSIETQLETPEILPPTSSDETTPPQLDLNATPPPAPSQTEVSNDSSTTS